MKLKITVILNRIIRIDHCVCRLPSRINDIKIYVAASDILTIDFWRAYHFHIDNDNAVTKKCMIKPGSCYIIC